MPGGDLAVRERDYAYGSADRAGKLTAYGKDKSPMVGVVLFRDGKRLASFPLAKLLVRTKLVSTSVSHIQWLAGDTSFLSKPLGAQLTMTTTSFRKLVFDTHTGKLSAKDTADWKRCDAIAYGKIKAAKKGSATHVMNPA